MAWRDASLKPGVQSSVKAPSSAPRRRFLSYLWGGLGLVALVEAIWLVLAFLRTGQRGLPKTAPAQLMAAGPVDAFASGSVTAYPRGRFYLVRLADGGFLALSRQCPHLGCTLPWVEKEGRFICPCHASVFDIRGEVLRSPAPHAMAILPVRIENGVVQVDTAHVNQRDRFEAAQVVYPQSSSSGAVR